MFKKEVFCMHCFAVNYEEKWIVCDSIHISIDYFIYLLEHFICIYSLGTQSSKLLIKSQHIQCTNHLTFKSGTLRILITRLVSSNSSYPPPFPHSLNVKWLIHWVCCDFINSFEDFVPDEKNTNKMFKKTN